MKKQQVYQHIYIFSLQYQCKIKCFVVRIQELITHRKLTNMKRKILLNQLREKYGCHLGESKAAHYFVVFEAVQMYSVHAKRTYRYLIKCVGTATHVQQNELLWDFTGFQLLYTVIMKTQYLSLSPLVFLVSSSFFSSSSDLIFTSWLLASSLSSSLTSF